jgi:hypothetical protein
MVPVVPALALVTRAVTVLSLMVIVVITAVPDVLVKHELFRVQPFALLEVRQQRGIAGTP